MREIFYGCVIEMNVTLLFILYVVTLGSYHFFFFVYFTGAEFPIKYQEREGTQDLPLMQRQEAEIADSDDPSIGYVTMMTVSDFMRNQKAKIADSDERPAEYETILDINYEVRFSAFSWITLKLKFSLSNEKFEVTIFHHTDKLTVKYILFPMLIFSACRKRYWLAVPTASI